jgi:hypothetical protein
MLRHDRHPRTRPGRARRARCPAIDRQLQAGVVPLTAAQMVSESERDPTSALNAAVCTLKIARCRSLPKRKVKRIETSWNYCLTAS